MDSYSGQTPPVLRSTAEGGPPLSPSGTQPPIYLPPSGEPLKPGGSNLRKALGPLAVFGVLLMKFKGVALAGIKFLPVILKTGGTMFLSIGAYAMLWGWKFAAGFVVLIFVHECGHLLAAKRIGLKVGAPVFIPFMGAIIALKEAPRNAWIEAQVGIGGPLLGTIGSVISLGISFLTGNGLFAAIAYSGFFLNLFNLAPIGFLDGGRAVTALSPWLWLVGAVVVALMMIAHFNFILLLIFLMSLPRLFSLFRPRTEDEKRYFEVTPAQRWIMAALYFGLIIFLTLGMKFIELMLKPE